MYISWRRHCDDPKVLEKYKAFQLSEDEQSMLQDYVQIPLLRGTIEKLISRQQARKAEAELKDTKINV